jgi:hypothetical protein
MSQDLSPVRCVTVAVPVGWRRHSFITSRREIVLVGFNWLHPGLSIEDTKISTSDDVVDDEIDLEGSFQQSIIMNGSSRINFESDESSD